MKLVNRLVRKPNWVCIQGNHHHTEGFRYTTPYFKVGFSSNMYVYTFRDPDIVLRVQIKNRIDPIKIRLKRKLSYLLEVRSYWWI